MANERNITWKPPFRRQATPPLVALLAASCAVVPLEQTAPRSAASPPSSTAAGRDTATNRQFVPYDLEPELVSMDKPQYPESEKASGVEGEVLCSLRIDATGRVSDVRVVQGLSAPFDSAAVMAAKSAMFKPARRKDGSAVAASMIVAVAFQRPKE